MKRNVNVKNLNELILSESDQSESHAIWDVGFLWVASIPLSIIYLLENTITSYINIFFNLTPILTVQTSS